MAIKQTINIDKLESSWKVSSRLIQIMLEVVKLDSPEMANFNTIFPGKKTRDARRKKICSLG
jgi:hypothetical protein